MGALRSVLPLFLAVLVVTGTPAGLAQEPAPQDAQPPAAEEPAARPDGEAPADAPVEPPAETRAARAPESIEIGLSTDKVSITSDFAGANLTIFGALDNADPLIARQGRYDVVVVLEGPPRPTVVRKKTRVFGMWINTDSVVFVGVPASYAMAMTRMPQDITDEESYRRLSLGADYIHLQPLEGETDAAVVARYREALVERKRAAGLYTLRVGGVQFLSQSLFRATLSLAPNVPVGTHKARAFLFRNGVFVRETSAPLAIQKSGIEQRIFDAAHQQSLAYGLVAVLIAMVTGWLGRLIFKRD
ncbi:TIGR02186 family protein [Aquibium sp. A9E412]|uniref:TIGR02186 family protein n=1 Tax=Aquibium sp. A9E412 TaxID=2976767 RepID=UPI0025B1CFA2|nr:TIGR02186 family protein [Aquibium sp. A9E412]MDN2567783.1 TIGR02186 family protein [Aquibium sp. A9E412]